MKKPHVILIGCSDMGNTSTTKMIEALEKADKTVLIVGENEMPDFVKERGINITPYRPLPKLIEPCVIDYGNKMSSRAARRKKERKLKKK